jgi:hypothetical protein
VPELNINKRSFAGVSGLAVGKNLILYEEILTPSKPLRKITPRLNENLVRRDFFY